MGQDSVLPLEGHDVGDGSEGGQAGGGDQEIAKLRGYFFGLGKILGQGPGEFECYAGAAEVLVGLILTRQIGMQDGKGRRQLVFDLVVVGND